MANPDSRRGWVLVAEQAEETDRFIVDLADEDFFGYSRLDEFTDRASASAYAVRAAKEWDAKLHPTVFG